MKKENYEIGYGKPPKKHQFKKGQSGNTQGRPKGATNKLSEESLYEMIDRIASSYITVHSGEQKLTITRAEAAVLGMMNAAVKGNTRALGLTLDQLKIIEERGLSKQAKEGQERAAHVHSVMKSMSIEQLQATLDLLREGRRRGSSPGSSISRNSPKNK